VKRLNAKLSTQKRSAIVYSSLLFSSVFLMPESSMAATAAHHGEIGIGTLFWPLVNFSIFAALLVYLFRKFGSPALKARAVTIEDHLRKSERELSEAIKEFNKAQQRLVAIEDERTAIFARFDEDAEIASKEIIASAEQSAKRVRDDLVIRLQNEFKQATNAVKAEMVEAAMSLAKEKLAVEFGVDDDRQLRKQALQVIN
jgi:F0F1-type ATP synthase membrane subunit b/b'